MTSGMRSWRGDPPPSPGGSTMFQPEHHLRIDLPPRHCTTRRGVVDRRATPDANKVTGVEGYQATDRRSPRHRDRGFVDHDLFVGALSGAS